MTENFEDLIKRVRISESEQDKDASLDRLTSALKNTLKISLPDEDYGELAKHMVGLKISSDKKTETSFTQQNFHSETAKADPIRVQTTFSTDSTTSDEYTSGGSRLNTPRVTGRAHDTDGTGASQPMNARSPMRPSADEQRQPPAARSHRYSSSDPFSATKSHDQKMPSIFAPPPINSVGNDPSSSFPSSMGSTINQRVEPPTNRGKPTATTHTKISPTRKAESPVRRRPESLRPPPSSPGMNRPGLQENDAKGIAQSPKTHWGASSHATHSTEDSDIEVAESDVDVGVGGVSLFAKCPPNGAPEMPLPGEQEEHANHHDSLFTPTARGGTGSFSSSEANEEGFKTAKNKNRRKDGTPYGMSGKTAQSLPSNTTTHFVGSSFDPTKFFPDENAFANAFNNGAQISSSRGRTRVKARMMNNQRAKNTTLNSQTFEDIMPASDTDAMEIDPNSPLASSQIGGLQSTGGFQGAFQMGTGGSSRATKARSMRRTNNLSQPTMPAMPVPPPDLSDVIKKIQEIREEAKNHYIAKEYSESIKNYTYAIEMYGKESYAHFLKDNLAVLHSNRAAALMMVGAFEASAWDCEMGIPHVTTDGDQFSSDAGPPLRVKLLTRLGKARFKLGDAENAKKAFVEAVNTADAIIDPSEQVRQSRIDASLAAGEAENLEELLEKIQKSMNRIESMNQSESTDELQEVLREISKAVTIAPGSQGLYVCKVLVLSKLRRWRELAGFCERIAANNLRFAGCFVGDLESKNPLPTDDPTQLFKADFFDFEYNESNETAHLKLNSRAAAEAILRMPQFAIQYYLRCLRLEERYPAAESCLDKLQDFIRSGCPRYTQDRLQKEFQWIHKEKDKLGRTKSARERGDYQFRAGDYELASACYTNCLAIDAEGATDGLGPTNNAGGRLHAVLHCNRAACLISLSKYSEALQDTINALTIHDKYMKAMLRRARCHQNLGQYPEAISEFKRYIKLIEDSKNGSQPGIMGSPCIFDAPKDVTQSDFDKAQQDLAAALQSQRKAQQTQNEERARRSARSNMHSAFSQSQSFNAGTSDARKRRDEWQNNHDGSRRWDSFRRTGPRAQNRSQSSDPRARSANFNDGPGRSQHHRREKSVDSPRKPFSSQTHYEVLGLKPGCSERDIKMAYRKLSKIYHPDRGDTADNDKMKAINEANGVLKDATKRREYDRKIGHVRRY